VGKKRWDLIGDLYISEYILRVFNEDSEIYKYHEERAGYLKRVLGLEVGDKDE